MTRLYLHISVIGAAMLDSGQTIRAAWNVTVSMLAVRFQRFYLVIVKLF
ncbi:MAG: hypothetical protein ACU836_14715 [Gammaproteobacteria bacterium]